MVRNYKLSCVSYTDTGIGICIFTVILVFCKITSVCANTNAIGYTVCIYILTVYFITFKGI